MPHRRKSPQKVALFSRKYLISLFSDAILKKNTRRNVKNAELFKQNFIFLLLLLFLPKIIVEVIFAAL